MQPVCINSHSHTNQIYLRALFLIVSDFFLISDFKLRIVASLDSPVPSRKSYSIAGVHPSRATIVQRIRLSYRLFRQQEVSICEHMIRFDHPSYLYKDPKSRMVPHLFKMNQFLRNQLDMASNCKRCHWKSRQLRYCATCKKDTESDEYGNCGQCHNRYE